MGFRPKKDVLNSISTRSRMRNGSLSTVYDAYLGYDPYSKKQKRIQSTSLHELRKEIERFYVEHRSAGDAAARLKPHEAMDARNALDLLAAAGHASSLTEIVENFLGASGTGHRTVMFQDALRKFLASQIGKTDVYTKNLRRRIGTFMDSFGPERPISAVTASDVTGDLRRRLLDEKNPKTWKTYNNHLGDLKTFFSWCTRSEQGYITKSPLADVKRLTIAWHDPAYMKPDAVARLFRTLATGSEGRREDLADAILSFFCGMRQEEIKRIREGKNSVNVDVANGFIRIVKCKGATNGIRPRAFNIPEPALTWMRAFDFDAAVMRPNNRFRRHLLKYAEAAGVPLPENAGRHTFITMHTAAYHDQQKLTNIVGNTEDIRANSYDGVEIEANGRAYFEITPRSLGISL